MGQRGRGTRGQRAEVGHQHTQQPKAPTKSPDPKSCPVARLHDHKPHEPMVRWKSSRGAYEPVQSLTGHPSHPPRCPPRTSTKSEPPLHRSPTTPGDPRPAGTLGSGGPRELRRGWARLAGKLQTEGGAVLVARLRCRPLPIREPPPPSAAGAARRWRGAPAAAPSTFSAAHPGITAGHHAPAWMCAYFHVATWMRGRKCTWWHGTVRRHGYTAIRPSGCTGIPVCGSVGTTSSPWVRTIIPVCSMR